ncbi:MAG: hypothetical protein JW395_3297 [Nitrospira sp.]|nr:hypothetical protein [Nitrospira sp.]
MAARLGFRVPPTIISNQPSRVREFANGRQVVAKAVSSGYVQAPEGNRAIFTSVVPDTDFEDLDGLRLAPVIFQELIPKSRDIRVTVVGQQVFAAEILSQERASSRIDWRATDDPNLEHRPHVLPESVGAACIYLVRELGLRFGAIDLALTTAGDYVFFEINPNGEWAWIEDQCGYPIAHTIALFLAKGVR